MFCVLIDMDSSNLALSPSGCFRDWVFVKWQEGALDMLDFSIDGFGNNKIQ